jgi:hypothetical protein
MPHHDQEEADHGQRDRCPADTRPGLQPRAAIAGYVLEREACLVAERADPLFVRTRAEEGTPVAGGPAALETVTFSHARINPMQLIR